MKLAGKLILTVLSAVLAGVLLWVSLPVLLIGFATQQLEARGFSNVNIDGLRIHLHRAEIDTIQLSSDGLDIDAHDLVLGYSPTQLSSGILDSIHISRLGLVTKNESPGDTWIPDTARIAGLLATPWYNYLPAHRIELAEVVLGNKDDSRTTHASLQLVRQNDELDAAVEIRGSTDKPHRLTLTLSPEGELVTILRGEDDSKAAPLVVVIVPGTQPGSLKSSLSADLTALGRLLPMLPADLKGRASLQVSLEDEIASEAGNARFEVNGHLGEFSSAGLATSQFDLSVSGNAMQSGNMVNVKFDEASRLTSHHLVYDDIEFSEIVINPPGVLSIHEGVATISANRFASTRHVRQGDLVINDASVTGLNAEIRSAADSPTLEGQFKLSISNLHSGDNRFNMAPASIQLLIPGSDSQSLSARATTSSASLDTNLSFIELESCELSLSLPANRVQSELKCHLKQQVAMVNGRLDYDLVKSSGKVTYHISDVIPDSERPLFNSMIKDWDEPYDLVSGQLSASGIYRWSVNSENMDMDLSVRDAGGYYEGIFFSGLSTEPGLTLLPDLATRKPASVSVDIFDVGIPVTDTRAVISMKPSALGDLPLVIVETLTMQLLDGSVSGTDIEYDFNADYNEFNLNVEGLNLATTVAMQQVEGLEASGMMDGSIPVFIDQQGLRVINGELHAREPGGRIRYIPEGGTESMEEAAPGTNIVFEILEDLNYQTLETRMNYVPDGNLILNLAIRGRSPKLDEKRPVHFNLNLEQNVLQLLKSLRIADDIDSVLDKNVQDFYKQNN